jgi:hypothetical protein
LLPTLLLTVLAQTGPALPQSSDAGTLDPGRPENVSVVPPEDGRPPPAAEGMSPAPPEPPPSESEARDHGVDFIPLPAVTFNSDTGFGLGAVLQLFVYAKDHRPYAHGITAQFFGTTTGFQSYYVSWDAPRLLGPVRVEAHAEFHRDPYAPYYGPGNDTFPGQVLNGPDRFFGYINTWTWDWVRFRIKPLGDNAPLTLYAGYQYRYFWITPYAGSSLATQAPNGINGGRNGAVTAGVLWDTRDDEQNTHRGFLVALSGRKAAAATASLYDYTGVTFGLRIFFSLWTPRLVLALHGVADHLWGDVPFWEWNQIGGISPIEGLGGLDSLRGIARNRYGGNTKVMGNAELRWAAVQIPWGKAPVEIGVTANVDTGRVWQPGQPDGMFFDSHQWHTSAGGGLRIARRAAVIRADFGVDLSTHRTGVYIAFGQLF